MAKSRKWAPHKKSDGEKGRLYDSTDVNVSGGGHFVTRSRVNDFVSLVQRLPDTDPVLRKLGTGIGALKELLSDSHLESVWSVRCAATSGEDWFMAAGDDSSKAQEAADAFTQELLDMDVPRIIEEMMDAVAFGFSPLEVLWTAKDKRWGIQNIVGKPPQWFEFDQDNRLVLKTGVLGTEELPPNRILLVQHRPSYANPYGVKIFSKCYWPVTFKKNGWRWWTVFVEKYGGAFTYGKYPANATEQFKNELLASLERLVSDAVAIAPEGSEITITSAADKSGSSAVHESYIKAANAEISKAVLGQTLTTEIGDQGSYAAAAAHNLVREDIATADRMRISAAFNRLAAVYTFYNFGKVAPPLFSFVKDEDLQEDRAKRDVELYKVGVRATKDYIIRQYGMQEGDFYMAKENGSDGSSDFNRVIPEAEAHTAHCACGCQSKKSRSIFDRFAALFTSADVKELNRDTRLMNEFEKSLLKAAQKETDQTVDFLLDSLDDVDNFEDAFDALGLAYSHLDAAPCAALISEARYAAIQIGAKTKAKGGRRNG
ncbi:MAG: DUF935 domain-containing protein [Treponema sp.]|jgi:phage gp29-like protein|nr:DUF935 domain-containing protein [Treponema sp.]